MANIQDIIERAKSYIPNLNEDRLLKAYYFADNAHAGQKRFSGEPYITHPLGVAEVLLDFHADECALVAALLHDVAEDTIKTLDDIKAMFGAEIHDLCWGLVKLSKVRSKLDDPQVENLRKFFLAIAKDFRVVLIKLCDRLHNMKTLEFVRPDKRKRIAQETINIYAPIASRLGIYRLKSQLEDLCFQYLYPTEFENIKAQLMKTEKWRGKYIEMAKQILNETLSREGIQVDVDGRVKSTYSIYRKMKRKGKNSIDEIFDVFAMRIVLPDIYKYGKEYMGHLYTALGAIHNNFTPLANRFKDYIAVPKVNGYRSLHTTIMGLGPKIHIQPTEIQIRTISMHCAAEFGIAAHWMYEEGIEASIAVPKTLEAALAHDTASMFEHQKDWVTGLQKIEHEIVNNQELLENLQVDVFKDRIFILTPRGDVKDLPACATPIDFAYAVHTEVGNTCVGARVNGNIVPLDYELKSGEVVEIITRKNAKPSQHWLSFAKTNHARNRVRAWFRDLDEDKHLRDGKTLLNTKLTQFGQPVLDATYSVLRNYGDKKLSSKQRENLVREIGSGIVLASSALKKIFTPEELLMGVKNSTGVVKDKKPVKSSDEGKPIVMIGGQSNVPYQFVKCCNADLLNELIGYVTRGRGVSLHRKHCSVIRNTEKSRLVPVRVLKQGDQCPFYSIPIHVEVDNNRMGLLKDLSQTISDHQINILDVHPVYTSDDKSSMQKISFTLEMTCIDQFERLVSSLEKIPNVRRVVKVNSGSN